MSEEKQINVPRDIWNEILKVVKPKLYLYLLSNENQQELNGEYYESAVVSAPDEQTARLVHPGYGLLPAKHDNWFNYIWILPEDVKVELIGAYNGEEIKVIHTSYVDP